MTRTATRTSRLRIAALGLLAAALCAVCGIGAWAHAPAFADDDAPSLGDWNHKEVYLEPGQRYNIGDSLTINTRVYIDKPGEYTLHGSSTIATVCIRTGGVTVHLEDGLKISPYGFANGQTAVSAITVEANSGDVRLVSKANATVKLDGYLEAPGVNKVGQGSRLIFETKDPARPGHIVCDRSGPKLKAVHTPGIGRVDAMGGSVSNIVFKSGKVTAKGYGNGAGIGSVSYETRRDNVSNIVIEGTAEVIATGGSGGAPGIGSVMGDTSVTIKGNAKVTATGTESAPGIGSGSQRDACSGRRVSVTIEGGTVTAQGGKNAPGIGSTAGNVDDIVISGGAVTAKGGEDAPGIGSTLGTVDAVKITGGAVTATRNGDSPGIGTGSFDTRTTRIEISGGIVSTPSARSGEPAIGTTSRASTADVRISGGTVDVKPGVVGVPKRDDDGSYGSSKVTINGGTVRTESLATFPAPVNSNGDRVRAATVSLENTDSGAVSSLTVKELRGYSYGTKDLELRGGHLYIWLPPGGAITEASHENSNCFSGTIIVGESATQGTLYLGNNVILDSGDAGITDGSARASGKATRLTNVSAPTTAEDGYVAASYLSHDRLIPVVDAATNQVVVGDSRYVDAATGTWIYEGTYPVTLLTRWKPIAYGIVYDANIPDGASTAAQAQGRMLPKDNLTFGDDYTLTPNQFSLPGYEFVGWSLKPDGDVEFDDRETITGEGIVIGSDGGPYTLYAQWKPRTYDVTFTSGDEVSGDAYTQPLTFDEERILAAVQFESNAYRFAGWTSSDGTVYADGATALNLCTVNGDGTLAGCTLTAQWTTDDHVTVVITCDDKPVEILDPEKNITLIPKGGASGDTSGTEITGFAKIAEGIYVRDNVPSGAYGIDFEPSAGEYGTSDITIEHEQGSNTPVTLAYYTATVNNVEDGHVRAFLNDPTPTGTSEIVVRKGTEATLWAGADAGYAFNGYTCVGVTPAGLDAKNGGEQAVTINGTVEITPHTRAARYVIAFDANAPSGASSAVHGETASASVAYGEGFALPENGFCLNGYTFAGWNTEADGTGTPYADRATVENLADADGETVTLYAQWEANRCTVSFDGNKPTGASTALSGSMADLYLSYDDEAKSLTANAFTLPGYEFAGWNTAADGTGEAFADGEAVRNLSSADGARVVLYAQWAPLAYTISFDAGEGGSGSMEPLTAAFDETVRLPLCAFTCEGRAFSHWSGLGLGSSYGDGAYVKNLCGAPNAGGGLSPVVLTANWADASDTAVVVRLNGSPDPTLDVDDVTLKDYTLNTAFACSSVENGRFVFEDLPDGEGPLGSFVIEIAGYDAGEAVVQRGETVTLDFYTVSIAAGDGIANAWLGGSTAPATELPNVRAGTVVRIGATAATGSVFDRYTAVGADPTWDPTVAEQSIVVNGAAEITAHARAAAYTVCFDANAPSQTSGAVSGTMDDLAATYGESRSLPPNSYGIEGYAFAGWNTEADGSGQAFGDGEEVRDLSDVDGEVVTLYAQWEANRYVVGFDGNRPAQASTDLSGSMADLNLTYGTEVGLTPNAFTLPGYAFAGWNTAADGTGEAFADGEAVRNLSSADGARVVLYAQWAPLAYTISFDAGEGEGAAGDVTGTMQELDVAFDETVQLPACGFAYNGHVFSHWSGLGLGSSYSDGAYVKNLCGTPMDDGSLESVTLTANWADAGSTAVVVRLNDEAASDLQASDVMLVDLEGGAEYRCSSSDDGRFVFEGVPDGVFAVAIDGYPADEARVRRGETVTLDFYTVSIAADDGIANAWLGDADAGTTELPRVLAGSTVSIGATAATGSVFERYTAAGVDPTWDPTVAEQSIVVNGAVEITAHARAAAYTVRFDANLRSTAASTVAQFSGSMENQDMVYGEAQALFATRFVLPGYELTGWSTAADGTGQAFADGETVSNLTAEDGATVTLYAQWRPHTYTVTYDPGDGGGAARQTTETFDEPFSLAPFGSLGFTAPADTPDAVFAGWDAGALGQCYRDEEDVVNLCSLDASGVPESFRLTALWADTAETTVVVTEDGAAATGFTANDVELRQNGASYRGAAEDGRGTFTFGAALPTGTFSVFVGGRDTGATVTKGGTVEIAYCTVEIAAEAGVEAWLVDPETGAHIESPALVLVGSRIGVAAAPDEGFSFERYTAVGVQPAWNGGDPSQASQTVTVYGTTLIEAHPVAVRYTVRFDANGGSGTMDDQDMVYGEPQDLFANAFTRAGYEFAGWNTAADGSGAAYADGEPVSNLAAVHGAAVTLYAQWSSVAPPPTPAPSTSAVDREAAGHGSLAVDPERAAAGTEVAVAAQPDEGYGLFSIEVVDEAGGQVPLADNGDGTFTFVMPEGAVTVKAVFKVILPFPDLDWSHWGYDDIALAFERGLMTGYDSGVYAPDDVTTRAMAVTVIWRLAGCPQASGTASFADVADGTWYTEAVRWAAEAGVTTGYEGTGLFGPEDAVTREQIVTLLMRYAASQGMDTSARGDLSAFPDGESASTWAREAVEWAAAENLLRGDDVTGTLDPQDGGTRAALATLVIRYDALLPVG